MTLLSTTSQAQSAHSSRDLWSLQILQELRDNPDWPVVLFPGEEKATRAAVNLTGVVCVAINISDDPEALIDVRPLFNRDVYIEDNWSVGMGNDIGELTHALWDSLDAVDAQMLSDKELLELIVWR